MIVLVCSIGITFIYQKKTNIGYFFDCVYITTISFLGGTIIYTYWLFNLYSFVFIMHNRV